VSLNESSNLVKSEHREAGLRRIASQVWRYDIVQPLRRTLIGLRNDRPGNYTVRYYIHRILRTCE
jgi:hypothetical protein